MKHIALIATCALLIGCSTTTAPDGTTVKNFDGDAFGQIVGGVVTIGGIFVPRRTEAVEMQDVEVTYSK